MKTVSVVRDPDIHGGELVFTSTRVPVRRLIEYLESGETVDEFLEGFPTVKREQALDMLGVLKAKLAEIG